MSDSGSRVDRRTFLGQSARVTGGAAIASTALSYDRILGANDRIALGHIGVGRRGAQLAQIAGRLAAAHNVEMTAVCDLWSVNRERAVAASAALLRPRSAGLPAPRGPPGAPGRRCGADRDARALALADPAG